MKPTRIALRIAQTGFFFAIMGASAVAQPDWSDPRAVFDERLATFIKDPGNFPYAPMEPLAGTSHWKPLAKANARQSGIAPEALEKARAYAQAMNSSAFIVWRDGRIESEWYGKGVDARTPLVSKSLSKPLTAIAVGRSIALGKIRSLDQSIADFIQSAKGTPKAKITIRYLLDMRSGMLDQGFSTDPAHPYNSALLDTDFGQRVIESYPMPYEPGTRYSYANAPSDLIAMVIEGATGQRYGNFLSREVLRPLGAQGGRIWVGKPGGLAHSGCCTYLPAETYLRMAVLLLDDGKWQNKRLLPQGYVAEMRKGTAQNPNFGLGIWIGEPYHQRRGFGAPGTLGPQVLHSEPYLDPELYLFDGNSNQIVAISPKYRLITLRVGPTPPAPKDGSAEWDNAFLPNTLIRGLTRH
ncbi:serine hydrolase domain-containing protein [Novosphingobium subterraneum]|uniref:serine hydrolase domain-containing protein n=1 Tax=Novosphingobium subterraneum TaxID=48936 RepID=UPI003CFDA4B7